MQVTLNCDASLNPKHKIGGWAFWLKADFTLPIKRYGKFKDQLDDINIGELQCIGNALTIAHAYFKLPDIDLVIYTDSMASKLMLLGNGHKPIYAPYVQYVRGLLETCHSYKIHHVRAHTRISKHNHAAHVVANAWCDNKARLSMQRAVLALDRKPAVEPGRPTELTKKQQKMRSRRAVRRGVTAYRREKTDFFAEIGDDL